MDRDNLSIAKRLAELRTFNDLSVEDAAEKLGITAKEYASFENGEDEIPIWLIYKFAAMVDIEPAYITTGKVPTKKNANVVYAGKGDKIQRYPGYSFTALASEFENKIMKPMLVNIAPSDSPELVCHGGQEFNYVLEGMLRVIVGQEEFYLRAGDSLYFDPSLPHAQLAMGDKEAKFLTIITE